MKTSSVLFAFLLTSFISYGQKSVLFTVGGIAIPTEEFAYTFNKNHQGNASKSEIDEYLNLFINFKLKVMEGRALGLDTLKTYLTELNTYKIQLTKPYLTEKSVTEQLIKEAYERLKTDIDASHILLTLPSNPTPKDTLEVYKKSLEIFNLTKGVEFEELVLTYSQEPAVSRTKGHLGYFTAFQMVYPFETAAYSTHVGEISMPIRSRFGYHIIKVHDRRPSNGKIQISHLMLRFNDIKTSNDSLALKNRILGIQALVLDNYNWEELVKNNSEDVNSKGKGGILKPFGVGEMLPVIAEAAFRLDTIGQVSDPVMSPFGLHLLRLENIETPMTFEEQLPGLEKRVSRDSRSNKSKEALIKRLKKENKFREDSLVSQPFRNQSTVPSSGLIDSLENNPSILFYLLDSAYSIMDFQIYLVDHISTKKPTNVQYQEFVNSSIIGHERILLPDKYPEFRHLMREYHEGILLFDVMNLQIWEPSSTDSAGLSTYFENNLMKYTAKESVTLSIFENLSKLDETKLRQYIEEIIDDSVMVEQKERMVLQKFTNTTIQLSGSFKHGDTKDEYFKIQGLHHLSDSQYLVVWKHLDETPLSFEESRGKVSTDYQQYLENEWIKRLKKKYEVTINKKELKKVYKNFEK